MTGPFAVEPPDHRDGDVFDLKPIDELSPGASWEAVECRGGTFDGEAADVTIEAARLIGCHLTGARLAGLKLVDVVLQECELSGLHADAARFERVRFEQCRLSGFVATELEAEDVTWENCRLDDSWFRDAALHRCAFVDCDLTAADLYGATIRSSRLGRCTLDRAELGRSTFEHVAMHGTSLHDLPNAAPLRNLIISTDQVLPLAYAVFASWDVVIDDDIIE